MMVRAKRIMKACRAKGRIKMEVRKRRSRY